MVYFSMLVCVILIGYAIVMEKILDKKDEMSERESLDCSFSFIYLFIFWFFCFFVWFCREK